MEDDCYWGEGEAEIYGHGSTPVDDPKDHDHGHTEAEHKVANKSRWGFFRGQQQGTVDILPGKTQRGDSVAGIKHTYSGDNQEIYGMSYDEYAALTPGDRADLRNAHR